MCSTKICREAGYNGEVCAYEDEVVLEEVSEGLHDSLVYGCCFRLERCEVQASSNNSILHLALAEGSRTLI